MHWAKLVILFCCLVEAGWMSFDGSRALLVGDYITPKAGPHAGQIGPWRHVVQRLGVNPRGTPMKAFFAAYGIVWLGLAVGFLRSATWGWAAMATAAAGAIWYLPFGTAFSVVQLVLLLLFRAALRP